MRLNTFEQVQKRYESTKPVNGSQTPKSLDVRPIGDRRRKHERIVKISDTCYALSDGLYVWGNVYDLGNRSTPEQVKRFSPIVWEKTPDGDTRVTVANGRVKHAPTSRFAFLDTWLPNGLRFKSHQGSGEHWIVSGGEEYFLPKSTVSVANTTLETTGEDNKFLVFEQSAGGTYFTLISKRFYPERACVDIDVKRPYKESIRDFYDWMLTMAPLLRSDTSSHRYGGERQFAEDLLNHYGSIHDLTHKYGHFIGPLASPSEQWDHMREITSDTQHPLRVALAKYMLGVLNYWHIDKRSVPYESSRWDVSRRGPITYMAEPLTQEELTNELGRLRQRYVNKVNKICGFTKTVTKGE